MRGIFILLFTSLFLTSCSRIIMTIYGIKNPDIEKSESLIKYAERKDIESNNLYSVSSTDYVEVMSYFNNNFPAIMIFDSNGNYIPYANTQYCNAHAFSFIDSLNMNRSYNKDSSYTINDLSSKMNSLEGKSVDIVMDNSTDYHIFIFWTRWTGRLNKTHVKIWENSAYSNENSNVKVYKVNMDFQEYWGMSKDECYKLLEGVTACQPNIN